MDAASDRQCIYGWKLFCRREIITVRTKLDCGVK